MEFNFDYQFDLSAPTTIPFLTIAGLVVVLIILQLGWRCRLYLLERSEKAVVVGVFPRRDLLLLLWALEMIVAGAALTAALTPSADSWGSVAGWVVSISGGIFVPSLLNLWGAGVAIADTTGLRRAYLGITLTRLRWKEIDWVYRSARSRAATSIRQEGMYWVTRHYSKTFSVFGVAGPKKRVEVSSDMRGFQRGSLKLLKMLQHQAPHVVIGSGKRPAVEELSKRGNAATPSEWGTLESWLLENKEEGLRWFPVWVSALFLTTVGLLAYVAGYTGSPDETVITNPIALALGLIVVIVGVGTLVSEGCLAILRAIRWLKARQQAKKLRAERLAPLDQAIRQNPTDVNNYMRKAFELMQLKRYQEMLAVTEQAIQLAPTSGNTYINKGAALQGLRRYNEALAAYKQAIRLNPTDPDGYNNRGNALLGLGRYEEALAAYEQAIKIDPKHVLAYQNKSVVLRKLGRYEEAAQAGREAERLAKTKE